MTLWTYATFCFGCPYLSSVRPQLFFEFINIDSLLFFFSFLIFIDYFTFVFVFKGKKKKKN
ncbi:unnamed protein product, partial [Schistosoma rodhaini]